MYAASPKPATALLHEEAAELFVGGIDDIPHHCTNANENSSNNYNISGNDLGAKAELTRARKRKDSSSSITTVSVAISERDSAYESPLSSSSSSLVEFPSILSPTTAFLSGFLADSPPLPQSEQLLTPSEEDYSPLSEAEEKEWTSTATTTLDLDLLNSLLTKDILDDMGQVILDENLTEKSTLKADGTSASNDDWFQKQNDLKKDDDVDDILTSVFHANAFSADDTIGDLLQTNALSDDEDLVKNFDSGDWESTFNECFQQLCY